MLTKRMRSLVGTAGVSLLALAMSAPAWAQSATPDRSTEAGSTTEDSGGLSEIVVTAQKREQNLQEVPIAISALGEAKISQLGIRDARDLSGLAPNVTVVQSTTSLAAAVISIRGLSPGGSESFGLDQTNAVYVDGVYIARSGASALDVMDLARVEVLRGPQGTLFGRNTTGGAIAFVSRDPSKEFRATATGGIGNYGAWTGKVSVDPGEIFGISSSFSYSHSERNGIVDNILQPDKSKDPGARRTDAFRVALKADIGGTRSIRYIFDWTKTRGRPLPFQLTNVANGTARPPLSVDGQPAITLTQQAPVQQYLAAATFLEPQCAALAVPTRAYRDRMCLSADGDATDKMWGHNFQIENDFGGFRIKATTGYRFWHSDTLGSDLDGIGTIRGPLFSNATLFNGMPASLLQFIPSIPAAARDAVAAAPVPTTTQGLFDTNNRRRHKQLSEEIEFSGDTDRFDWVVGGFYFWEKGSEYNRQNSGFVLDTNTIYTANFGALGPSFVAANPARYRLVQTLSLLEYTAQAESVAVYGQSTFYVDGRDGHLSLTGGLRYTWDHKQISRAQSRATRPATPDLGAASFKRLTWNAMVRYAFTPDVSVYARAASGYRSGGFNAPDTTQAGTNTLVPFDSEKIVSYELGLKSELFDRRLRLNIAGYYNKFDDLAVTVPVATASPGVFGSRIINAGKVDYAGVELDGQAVLTDNFSIDGTFGYVDVKYKEFLIPTSGAAGAPVVNIASIASPGYTSKITGNIALNAQFPLGFGDARLLARVGYTYESPKYSFNNIIAAPFNEVLRGDPRKMIDAQIVVDRIPLAGGEAEFKLWGRNLTNQHQFARAVDFGSLGYAGGYFAEPRTYGATATVKF